ncbi:MAG: flagellar motor switch protein FliN [Firmicutes bacterium]|mgnify:CR=1 FL=1|nr:flagellar motor switch protein FliN [Bacillota bacterium]
MTGSILSQGEIDALLHGTASPSHADAFLRSLRAAFFSALGYLQRPSSEAAVDGPYVEHVEHGLAQAVAPEAFAVAAELAGRELLVLVPLPDVDKLAQELGVDALPRIQAMAQAWVFQVAAALGVPYKVYQGQKTDLNLLPLPSGSRSHLLRFLLRWGQERMEFCAVVQDFDGLERLAAGAELNRGQGEIQPALPKGKLMKGPELAVSKAMFTPIGELTHVDTKQGLGLLEDIDLTITVELGRATLTLNQILELKPQSLIKLDKLAGEPVDVFVNNNRVARGEVVVLDDNFGVRILEIVPKSQRTQE